MALTRCPYCLDPVEPGALRCIWCNADLSRTPITIRSGDTIRIRNPFKGGHVEDVTVVQVEREGWAIEVKDHRGQVWGYIKPHQVVEVLRSGREQG